MTVTLQRAFWIYCDGIAEDGQSPCDAQIQIGQHVTTATEVRTTAKIYGWKTGKQDFCEECVKRKAQVHHFYAK